MPRDRLSVQGPERPHPSGQAGAHLRSAVRSARPWEVGADRLARSSRRSLCSLRRTERFEPSLGWVGGSAWDGPALRRPLSLRAARIGFVLATVRRARGAAAIPCGPARSVKGAAVVEPVTSHCRPANCIGGRTGDVVLGALRSVGRRRTGPPSCRFRWVGLEASRSSRLRSARSSLLTVESALPVEADAAADLADRPPRMLLGGNPALQPTPRSYVR